jgi:RNA polymerase sigma-70 factor, ECF subfamily
LSRRPLAGETQSGSELRKMFKSPLHFCLDEVFLDNVFPANGLLDGASQSALGSCDSVLNAPYNESMAQEQAMQDQASGWKTVREIATGKVDWDRVYADQLPRVYNYFRFRIRNQADVEDLTSRTFEKAWRAREKYRAELAGVSTWLFAIARNVAIDHVRASVEHLPMDAADETHAASTPEIEIATLSDVTHLNALAAELPDRERDLLAMKYGAALTNRAIAQLTGLSESNVGTILSRTVEKLRARW